LSVFFELGQPVINVSGSTERWKEFREGKEFRRDLSPSSSCQLFKLLLPLEISASSLLYLGLKSDDAGYKIGG
jgi:hypothetical protein